MREALFKKLGLGTRKSHVYNIQMILSCFFHLTSLPLAGSIYWFTTLSWSRASPSNFQKSSVYLLAPHFGLLWSLLCFTANWGVFLSLTLASCLSQRPSPKQNGSHYSMELIRDWLLEKDNHYLVMVYWSWLTPFSLFPTQIRAFFLPTAIGNRQNWSF